MVFAGVESRLYRSTTKKIWVKGWWGWKGGICYRFSEPFWGCRRQWIWFFEMLVFQHLFTSRGWGFEPHILGPLHPPPPPPSFEEKLKEIGWTDWGSNFLSDSSRIHSGSLLSPFLVLPIVLLNHLSHQFISMDCKEGAWGDIPLDTRQWD